MTRSGCTIVAVPEVLTEPAPVPVKQSLEDVTDVVAFASWQAERVAAKARASFGEDAPAFVATDEVKAEAVLLIYELHGEWDPVRCAKFSAYLLYYLPRRLTSWWRRELRQSGRGTWAGSRSEYVFYRCVSLDAGRADEQLGELVYDRDD